MLINEVVLDEDIAETKDLMSIAHYVAKWMMSEKHKNAFNAVDATLKEIEQISGNPIPPIKSYWIKWLLFKPIPEHTNDPLRFIANHPSSNSRELGYYMPVPSHIININLDLLEKTNRNPASTILHELQHALDDLKSGGRAFLSTPYKQPKDDYQAYIKHPMEVNARFSQALWDLATNYETVARSDVYSAITNNLEQHRIKSQDFDNPKEYRRLITRAYKFLADVSQIIDKKEKPGFVQKIKTLIKKWMI